MNDSNIKHQLKLIPTLTKIINKTITRILEETHGKTKKYLEEYCEMQKEMIFCNETEYIEAFQNYFKGEGSDRCNNRVSDRGNYRGSDRGNNRGSDRGNNRCNDLVRSSGLIRGSNPDLSGTVSGLVSGSSSVIIDSYSSISDDLPLKRIQSESLETLTKQEEERGGFLKEILALLFPNVKNIKRVEYRPKKRGIISNKKIISSSSSSYALINNISPTLPPNKGKGRDEEFLLKLLEIYLKSYHRQLSDFLPKCINYHLIHETLKQLSISLLKSCNVGDSGGGGGGGDGDGWQEEIKRIKMILKMIEEINI